MDTPLCSCRIRPARPGKKTCSVCAERSRTFSANARAARPRATDGSGLSPAEAAELEAHRPRTRGDCAEGPRPCPFVSCRHHLLFDQAGAWLDWREGGGLADDEAILVLLETMPGTCTLDVADEGGLPLEEAGRFLGLTRERMRQIEAKVIDPERSPLKGTHKVQAVRRHEKLRVLAGDALHGSSRG